jgi:hypothetical protein
MDKSNILPRFVFTKDASWVWIFIGSMALTTVEMILVLIISLRLGHPITDFDGYVGGLFVLNYWLAMVGVDRIYKRFGYSPSATTHQTQSRMRVQAERDFAHDEVVELPVPKPFIRASVWCCLFLCPAIVFDLIFILPKDRMLGIKYALYLSSALGLLGFCIGYLRGVHVVRANSRGIDGPRRDFPFGRKFVPWSEIEACEILTYYNTFGGRTLILPIFKDRLGKKLLSLDLSLVMPSDQDRLVKYIKAKLPKSPFESFEV